MATIAPIADIDTAFRDDIFDLDYQATEGGPALPDAAYTEGCTSPECGPSGTCWTQSCSQCCASSDWDTGC